MLVKMVAQLTVMLMVYSATPPGTSLGLSTPFTGSDQGALVLTSVGAGLNTMLATNATQQESIQSRLNRLEQELRKIKRHVAA